MENWTLMITDGELAYPNPYRATLSPPLASFIAARTLVHSTISLKLCFTPRFLCMWKCYPQQHLQSGLCSQRHHHPLLYMTHHLHNKAVSGAWQRFCPSSDTSSVILFYLCHISLKGVQQSETLIQ